ncbi:DUF1453 domain-containing protein [Streptomyces marispadix]|uniref:DUF1453 domain-containing protein n=1 Tax=Streptomyces marispadix TaxID=2922868 RepID=A0ABS9SUS2_9ACTN|nr:DUF1453 domain-containing protein [Streptomyces marispadix]MCH6160020.1 DUF1453 domain-containing protein [Streptomyces marispadix]
MNGWTTGLLIAALVAGLVIKRLYGEPLNARELLGAPVILTGVGVWNVAKTADVLTAADIGWVAGGSVLGFALGALRGRTVSVFERDGVAWQRYTIRTFLAAVGSFAVMGAFGYLAVRAGMHEHARPLTLSIGVSYLGESLAVALSGLATGLPFAAEGARR